MCQWRYSIYQAHLILRAMIQWAPYLNLCKYLLPVSNVLTIIDSQAMISGAILYCLLLKISFNKTNHFQIHKNTSFNTQITLASFTTSKEWIINIVCPTMICFWWANKALPCVFNTTALQIHVQGMCFKTVASLFMTHRLVLLLMII